MDKITTIIPVDKYDETVKKLLEFSIRSLVETSVNNPSPLIIVGPKDVLENIKSDGIAKDIDDTVYLENEDSWFSTQINKAVKNVTTDYFSILEYDDEFSPIWYDNVAKYVDSEEGASIYLPLTEVYDYQHKEQGAIGYVNEAVWASSFSERIGYFDSECLQDYLLFNTTGGVFKTKDFIEVGGLKESIKLAFWYEFMLRAIRNKKDIFVIPKVGYFHIVNRPESLASSYAAEMSDRESEFWVELARKECFFKKDRKKTYEE